MDIGAGRQSQRVKGTPRFVPRQYHDAMIVMLACWHAVGTVSKPGSEERVD